MRKLQVFFRASLVILTIALFVFLPVTAGCPAVTSEKANLSPITSSSFHKGCDYTLYCVGVGSGEPDRSLYEKRKNTIKNWRHSMPTPQEFLSSVLAPLSNDEVYFAIGLNKSNITSTIKRPDIVKCSSVDDILAASEKQTRFGLNSYFALGSYGAAEGRKRDNLHNLNAFWLDIDVGKGDKTYKDVDEAAVALSEFTNNIFLEPTYVVFSGRGLHVYWATTQPMAYQDWLPAAQLFKDLCKKKDFLADPVVIADGARILRVPGSYHIEAGVEVEVVYEGPKYDTADIAEKLLSYPDLELEPEKHKKVYSSGAKPQYTEEDALFGIVEEPPSADIIPIAEGCKQIRDMGLGSEEHWFHGMTVLKRCKEGREAAHILSQVDTVRYNAADTDAKFDHAASNMPATCATFNLDNPGVCQRCVHWKQIKSPVELDRLAPPKAEEKVEAPQPDYSDLFQAWETLDKVIEPKPLVLKTDIENIPPLQSVPFQRTANHPYYVNSDGVYYVKTTKQKDGSYISEDILLTKSKIEFHHIEQPYDAELKSDRKDYIFSITAPNDTYPILVTFPSHNNMPNMKWCLSVGIVAEQVAYYDEVVKFMNAYLSQVQLTQQPVYNGDHYGWHKMSDNSMAFLVDDALITDKGVVRAAISSTSNLTSKPFSQAGSLDAWTLAPKIYRILDQKLGQLGMCLSFAAPFIQFNSAGVENCIFNVYSQDSGRGKSQLLRMAASVWGDPSQSFYQKDSSVVAREKRLAVWHNLPAMMDEITHLSSEDLTSLVFATIDGTEKQKLTKTSEFRKTGSWSTVAFMSGNVSLKDAMSTNYAATNAGVVRVMDLECDFQPLAPGSAQQRVLHACMKTSQENYGLAGPALIQSMLAQPDRIRQLPAHVDQWVAQHKFNADERFISYPLAIALQVGRWCVELGLLDYDMDALEEWVLKELFPEIRRNNEQVKKEVTCPVDLLTEYINERITTNALIVKNWTRTTADPPVADSNMPDGYVIRRPSHSLTMRYEVENNHLYFSQRDFGQWCRQRKWKGGAALKTLKEQGYITQTDFRMTLGKHVKWLPSTRVLCASLDEKALTKCGVDLNTEGADENA